VEYYPKDGDKPATVSMYGESFAKALEAIDAKDEAFVAL
jgi:hypothetical protein